MTPEISIHSESKEIFKLKDRELEAARSAGIAILIVGIDPLKNGDNKRDPLFWTIKELEDKPDTKKSAGEISIPAETRKIGESRDNNVLGALAEFCDDSSLGYVREHLFKVEGLFSERSININGNLVDVTVLLYDGGLNHPLVPLSSMEVAANAWLSREQIQNMKNIRSVLSQALNVDQSEGLSTNILERYYNKSNMLIPVFTENIKSMQELYKDREFFSDVPLRSRPQA